MLAALTAAPAALLFLGSWPRLVARLPRRWRVAAPAVAALLAVASAAALGIALVLGGGESAVLPLSPWSGAVFDARPELRVDALSALCLFLIGLSALVAVLRGIGEGPVAESVLAYDSDDAVATDRAPQEANREGGLRASLAVSAAAALFVAASRSPLGLALAWIVFDLALAGPAKGGRRSLLGGQIGLFLALAGLTGAGRAYLVAAGAVRAGLYPLSWSVPRCGEGRPWRALGVRLPATIAGLHLAFVAGEGLRRGAGIDRATLVAGMVAVAFGAAHAFLAKDRSRSLEWTTTAQAGLVLLALSLNDPIGRAIAVTLLVAQVLNGIVRHGAEGLAGQQTGRLASRLTAAALVGIPPTLGFCARWLLYDNLLARGQRSALAALAVAVVGAALLAAPARPQWRPAPAPRRAGKALAGLLLGVAVAELALGIGFPAISWIAQATGASRLPHPLGLLASGLVLPFGEDAASGLDALRPVGEVLLRLLLIGIAPLVGWALRRIIARRTAVPRVLRAGLTIAPAFELLLQATLRIGAVAQLRSGLVEGRRAMAITLLGAAVLAAALLGPPAQAGGSWPAIGAWPLIVLAALATGALLLMRARLWTLGAIVLGHVVAALHLALSGAPIFVAAVQLLVGVLAAGMLAISVMQAPVDRRLAEAARRLRALRARGLAPNAALAERHGERLTLVLALAMAVSVAIGMPQSTHIAGLAGRELAPAIVLLMGGLLAVLFARGVLELSAGVLLSLTGFEAIYGLVDAGLLVTGVLAVVQLLFAVVASAFVGSSPTVVVSSGSSTGDDPAEAMPDVQPEVP